jgi:hypothetical protein
MVIYAILGINLFAQIKNQTFLNDNSNFRTLLPALIILAKTAIGQDWTRFMLEAANLNIPGCIDGQTYSDMQTQGVIGCGTAFAYPYFITYIILVTLILVYLFLAIVIGGYADCKKESEAIILPHQMEEFLDKWAEYDPLGTGFISPEAFAFLIHDLPPPIGVKDDTTIKYEFDATCKIKNFF